LETSNRTAADATNYSALSDQISTETTSRQAGDAAVNTRVDGLQAEVDRSQLGAGLNVDGTFTAPENTNYLGSVTSLKTADVALDSAIHTEVSRATTAEASLASGLANEVQARQDGDANLQAQLQQWVNTQLASNQANDLAETSARIAADASLQSELDTTQAAIGLDTNGNIIPVTGTNYLDGIQSVFAGAFALDTQIKKTADAIAAETTARATADSVFQGNLDVERDARIAADLAIRTELDNTQTGAGLETDGSYAAPTGSNYLGSANSLKDADYLLDAAIKSTRDSVTSLTNSTTAALDLEASNRQAADAAITAGLDIETTARQGADALLQSAIDTEALNRQMIDQSLADSIQSETSARQAADSAIQASLGTLMADMGKIYFLYDGAAATSHTVSHGLSQKYASVTVVDATTNEVIIPQSIVFNDANTLTVTLNAALAIKVVVMAVGFAFAA
jgi:hypothetical protein